MIVSYRQLFSNRNFRLLAIVQAITYFGAWFSQVGVYQLLVQDFKANENQIMFATFFAFLPTILLAPISGTIIDIFKPKKLLITLASIELLSVLGLFLIKDLSNLWFLFLLIFVRLAVAGMYFQTQMALLAKMLNADELKSANELYSIIWAASYTSGMAFAGIFIHFFGVKMAFLFDCILFAIGIFLLTKTKAKIIHNVKKSNPFLMAKEGLVYILKNKKIIHILLLHAFVAFTTYDTLINYLAKFYLDNRVSFFTHILSAAILIGLSNSIRAISLTIGPNILKKFVNDKNTFYIYLAQGIGIWIWGLTQNYFYLSLIGMIFAGFCTSTLWSYTYTKLQVVCDSKFYGRVLAYNDMFYALVSLLTTLLTGYLHEFGISLFYITLLIGLTFIIGAFYWKFYLISLSRKN